jgi:hypothetical protein
MLTHTLTFEFGLQLPADTELKTYYVKAYCSDQAIDYAKSLQPAQAFFRTYLPDRCMHAGVEVLDGSTFL